jgi:hypothetical protein
MVFFAWDYWDGVWGVGEVDNLCCNGQSSFENWGSTPPQVTTIYSLGMCFRREEFFFDHIDFVYV